MDEGDDFTEEATVPLGNLVATVHFDQVGIKSLIFYDFASLCPFPRLLRCCLVLDHNMVPYGEGRELFGAVLELFMLEEVTLSQCLFSALSIQSPLLADL